MALGEEIHAQPSKSSNESPTINGFEDNSMTQDNGTISNHSWNSKPTFTLEENSMASIYDYSPDSRYHKLTPQTGESIIPLNEMQDDFMLKGNFLKNDLAVVPEDLADKASCPISFTKKTHLKKFSSE